MTFRFAVLSPTKLELGKDGLVGRCLLPVIAMIELARRDKVVIGLAPVCDKVPSITEELRDQLDRLGNLVALVVGRVAPPLFRKRSGYDGYEHREWSGTFHLSSLNGSKNKLGK